MNPRKTDGRLHEHQKQHQKEPIPDMPILEEQDWGTMESGSIRRNSITENDNLHYDDEHEGESLEEEDDNAYQHSDEALPNDREEAAINRHPDREGGLFDEN